MEELQNVKCLFPFGGIALCASLELQDGTIDSYVVETCMRWFFEHRKHRMQRLTYSLIDAYN